MKNKKPRFIVIADPTAKTPQEILSFSRVDTALSTLTRVRRGKWPLAQIVEAGK